MVICGVCKKPYKNDNSRAVHASTSHRGVPASVYAPDRVLKRNQPAPQRRRDEYVPQSGDGPTGARVATSTALPAGYRGKYWTTESPSLGTVFHYYE